MIRLIIYPVHTFKNILFICIMFIYKLLKGKSYMKKCILALDQGTTSSRAIIFDRDAKIVSVSQKEYTQIYKNNGWVEHDPMEIWDTQFSSAKDAIRKAGDVVISAIGITNQRETTIIWDKKTGKPVYNAIVWMCRRTADYCSKLIESGDSELIREKTGLVIDPYFSATKIRWILNNVEGAKEKAENGELLFGTVDSWLLYNLTGGKVHATDYTNASRTMLFNIFEGRYDEELLDLFGIPSSLLPEVRPCDSVFGYTDLFGGSIPISGIAGDQHASLFGNLCFENGLAKNTYGTGCFTLMNTGETPIFSKSGLVTTIGYNLSGKTYYALEGSVFNAGSTVQWFRDEMNVIEKSEEIEEYARKVADTGDVYIVPAFSGLGAPYWDMYARGTIIGMTRGTNKYHIARAILESMAFQTVDILHAMENDAGIKIRELKADGGASKDKLLLQMQADLLNCKVISSTNPECTSLGAAFMAALGSGLKEITDFRNDVSGEFVPSISEDERTQKLIRWHKAVSRSQSWISD